MPAKQIPPAMRDKDTGQLVNEIDDETSEVQIDEDERAVIIAESVVATYLRSDDLQHFQKQISVLGMLNRMTKREFSTVAYHALRNVDMKARDSSRHSPYDGEKYPHVEKVAVHASTNQAATVGPTPLGDQESGADLGPFDPAREADKDAIKPDSETGKIPPMYDVDMLPK